ncbi:spore germination protein [Tumebacillus sp. DT12]|uniref:Spore germination protein n=1 Tax=Tumebacillus lacus TaxID=2995335 RepID=A0ABT3X6S8_9BACL|nr:spore germination protein [Tumebacillus lacus]MCX7571692.1 spore germination protein [Tumebacillus lacus]
MKILKELLLSKLIEKLSTGQGQNDERPDHDVANERIGTEDGEEKVRRVLAAVSHAQDVETHRIGRGRSTIHLIFLKSLVDLNVQQRDVIKPMHLVVSKGGSTEQLRDTISINERDKVVRLDEAVAYLLSGWTLVAMPGEEGLYGFKTSQVPGRGVSKAENQSIVIGPQDGFTESIDTNLSLIRKRLRTPNLRVEGMKVGELTQTSVIVLSIKGVANEEYVEEMKERIGKIDVDALIDSGTLAQWIDDQPLSPFPQFNLVERPDSACSGLIDGKVVVLIDGTPYVCMGPSSFIEFFHSPEDYFNRWMSSSLVRLLRLFGVVVSITFSAIYVAVLTYHYEIIPANMLKTIAQSRARVPFPPLYEAVFLELTLEVLREAGVRLPTKVGQTMGIVGGIVIGQAAVSAGLTSNVMIIVVSLSALASFVTPSYVMGNAVRVIRFPIILIAGLWGFIGLSVGLVTILIHLLNLSSIGAPYMSPYASLRLADLKDTMIRVPTQLLTTRPAMTRAQKNKKAGNTSLKRK